MQTIPQFTVAKTGGVRSAERTALPHQRPSQPHTERLGEIAARYQRVLAGDPRNVEALLAMSLVAVASRQTEAAMRVAQAAVTIAPQLGAAWVVLAQALKAADRFGEAESACREAIKLDGMNTLARITIGELKIATGRAAEALGEFKLALQREPTSVAAHVGLGNALGCLDRFGEAFEEYERALAVRSRLPEAEFAAGFALVRLGRREEAESRYRRALTLRPDFVGAWLNLGCLLRDQGSETYARAALERALELCPGLIAGWINLALLARDLRRPAEAEAHLRKAFELGPDKVEVHVAWCQFRAGERDMAGAWGWLRWALAREPDHPEALNMLGILLHTEGRFADAVPVFTCAEAQGSRQAPSNRGNSLLDLGRASEALHAHRAAVELDPASAGARYNLALTELRLGDWVHGWKGYESRWEFREVHRWPRRFDQPRWRGEALNGQRVLVHAEQGLGDTIQFCRYAVQVVARGGFPVLQVQAPVARLLQSLPVVRSGVAEIGVLGEVLPAFDVECPLMSLPAVFGTTVETVPSPGAYLGARPEEIEEKRSALPVLQQAGGLNVGLAWAGNPSYKSDHQRSVALATLAPLLRAADMNWVALQKGEPARQIAALPGDVRLSDGSSHDRDLADTAGLIASLDLVITTDTCIAHLAGAMAKPVWIMLPYLADWRWMQDRETTPWYPTARLFRQSAPGDWCGVLERVTAALRRFEAEERRCALRRVPGPGVRAA